MGRSPWLGFIAQGLAALSLLAFESSTWAAPGPSFRELAARVQPGDSENRRKAMEQILARPDWKSETLKLASSSAPQARTQSVALLLLDLQDAQFAQTLVRLLSDARKPVRTRAADAAAAWQKSPHAERVRAALAARLPKESETVPRYNLVSSLSAYSSVRSLDALIAASKDPIPEIRQVAIHGLGNLTLYAASVAAAPAMRRMIEISASGSPADRIIAFYYVSRSGGSPGKEVLRKIASAGDEDPDIRRAAKDAAGEQEAK